MKAEGSGRYELDWRNIIQVVGALLVGVLSIYSANTEAFNVLFSKYVDPETFTVVTMVLAYLGKKYLTNYTK